MASASKKLLKELPSEERMNEIMSDLKAHGPQATAIMGAAYLEHALELLLRASFRSLSKAEDKRIFESSTKSILATFSAKIRIAYAAKLLHENVQAALLLINDVRNVFAHSLHSVDFNHELVAKDCQRLTQISPGISGAAELEHSTVKTPIDVYSKIVELLYHAIRHKVEDLSEPPAEPAP